MLHLVAQHLQQGASYVQLSDWQTEVSQHADLAFQSEQESVAAVETSVRNAEQVLPTIHYTGCHS